MGGGLDVHRIYRAAVRHLAAGHSLLAYPEGRISPDGAIGGFKDGAFIIAVTSQVPVVPVAIEGTRGCGRRDEPQSTAARILGRRGCAPVHDGESILPHRAAVHVILARQRSDRHPVALPVEADSREQLHLLRPHPGPTKKGTNALRHHQRSAWPGQLSRTSTACRRHPLRQVGPDQSATTRRNLSWVGPDQKSTVIPFPECYGHSYGAWPSPVSARDAAGAVWLRSATLAHDGAVWWQEIRPCEGGRSHLLRASADGHVTDVLDDQVGF